MKSILDRCIILFGRQRSGTTVLRRALQTHPLVRDLGEIMHPQYGEGFYHHLSDRLKADHSNGVHSRWFEIFLQTIEHLSRNDNPETIYIVDVKYNMAHAFGNVLRNGAPRNYLIDELKSRNAAVIHLVRQGKLQLLVSEKVAIKTSQWEFSNKSDDDKKEAQVHISPVTLGMRIAQELAQDDYFARELSSFRKRISLKYEEMFTDELEFKESIFSEFSGLMSISQGGFSRTPLLSKQGRAMSETLTNFDQVSRALNILISEQNFPSFLADNIE